MASSYGIIKIKDQLGIASRHLLSSSAALIILREYVQKIDLDLIKDEKMKMQLEESLAIVENITPDIKDFYDQVNNAFRGFNEMNLGELEI